MKRYIEFAVRVVVEVGSDVRAEEITADQARALTRKWLVWAQTAPRDLGATDEFTDVELESLAWAEAVAVTLLEKGVTARVGLRWDGACGYDHEFWYFHPLRCGGIGVYYQYPAAANSKSRAHDVGDVNGLARSASTIAAISALPVQPSRAQIWAALDPA